MRAPATRVRAIPAAASRPATRAWEERRFSDHFREARPRSRYSREYSRENNVACPRDGDRGSASQGAQNRRPQAAVIRDAPRRRKE